ncbi:MAG: V-type ATP synthase subunit F [Candidatus Micrarchaeaceae archaeon]
MTYKIAIVGNELLCTGFELAGVATYIATSAEQAQKIIVELLGQDIGIIGISSGLLKGIDRELAHRLETGMLPMVVELPEYGEEIAEDTLRKLIIRAVGIDLEAG